MWDLIVIACFVAAVLSPKKVGRTAVGLIILIIAVRLLFGV